MKMVMKKKIELMTANFSTSYDFLAEEFNFQNLSTNIRTKVLGKNLNFRTEHSFYKPDSVGSGRINEFEKFPRLLTFNTSIGFSINNKTFQKKEDQQESKSRRTKNQKTEQDTTNQIQDDEDDGILRTGGIQVEKRDFVKETKNIALPWSASFNLNYNINKTNIKSPIERIDLSANARFQLTKNWKISWNGRFDIVKKEITVNSFSIWRDLHCWEMSFDWQPMRDYYSFQINVKASALQDIKVTKHPSRSTYAY